MKLRKLTLISIITFVTICVASIFSASYAATGSMHLQIKMLRKSGYGYKALEKNIWKICETINNTPNYNKTIYCLKGGPGFGSNSFGSGTPQEKEYTQYFDMKNPSEIPTEYASALPSTTSSTYKSLVWLLENVYVAPKENASEITSAEEYKNLLLTKAGIAGGYITDDDIDAVQQLAVWHFTNNDEYKVEYGNPAGTFEFWINAIKDSDGNYNALSDEIGEGAVHGWERAEECQTLYTYLITEAERNSNYTIAPATAPYKIAELTQTIKTIGNNYVIGPYKVNQVSSTSGTITAAFKNGTTTITPILQDENGNAISSVNDAIGKNFYIVIPTSTNIDKIKFEISGSYFGTRVTYWSVEDAPETEQPVAVVERGDTPYSEAIEFTPTVEREFDMALRKFIVSINGEPTKESREPKISNSTLADLKNGNISTAVKTHPKNALEVKTGDKVIYKIRVYNEGTKNGHVGEITDYLPEGLEFVPVSESTTNKNNGWENPTGDKKTIVTKKLANTLLNAFDGTNLQSLDVEIECEVVATEKDKDNVLKNIAEITKVTDENGKDVTDRDSVPGNVNRDNYGTKSQEDDDDFEQLVILGKYFDLSLRKFITAINDKELVDEKGKYIREPQVVVTPLLNTSSNSKTETTAIYNHSKVAVGVDVGDEVVYTLRIYNEGQIAGYANEVVDHLPEYLEFVNDKFNASYGWSIGEDGRTVTTTITSPDTEYSASRDTIYANRKQSSDKVILDKFNGEKLDYIDIKIKCKVKDTGLAEKITNIAEITKASDSEGAVTDRDSKGGNLTLPSDATLPEYKESEINRGDKYIPGQEDDDDFEKVVVQKFDLSLRKFITGVNDKKITNRAPVFSMNSKKEYTYTHTKTPVEVANGDIVIYTLRVYNEGNQAGYADEVKDNLPEGLEYLPDNKVNETYRWKMYKEDGTETTKVSEAKTIRTDYLSKAQEEATGRKNLIKAFNASTMSQPDYKEVKVAFKVTEPNTSDRILINTAEISKDSDENGNEVDDIDSTPDNNKNGEDDIDIEKVKVKYFDLALKKIVSEVRVTVDGKTTVTKTKHKFEQEPEPVVKVELNSNKVKNATIKFKYQIRVTNEGEIAGYAKEIKDYIPKGLKFVASDNKNWKLSSDGKTITTTQLENKLLKPGESTVIEVVFTWINGQNNLGLKTNIAEISKDYNDHNSPDIDSTPDNKKEGEDDIDDASVILSVQTGGPASYIAITGSVLAILVGGVVLIKKFII